MSLSTPRGGQYLWDFLHDNNLLEELESNVEKICAHPISLVDETAAMLAFMDYQITTTLGRSRFGYVSYRKKILCLNICLWTTQPDQFMDTLLHELAHILAWEIFRGRGHSNEWRYCAHMIGATPKRCGPELVPATTYKKDTK